MNVSVQSIISVMEQKTINFGFFKSGEDVSNFKSRKLSRSLEEVYNGGGMEDGSDGNISVFCGNNTYSNTYSNSNKTNTDTLNHDNKKYIKKDSNNNNIYLNNIRKVNSDVRNGLQENEKIYKNSINIVVNNTKNKTPKVKADDKSKEEMKITNGLNVMDINGKSLSGEIKSQIILKSQNKATNEVASNADVHKMNITSQKLSREDIKLFKREGRNDEDFSCDDDNDNDDDDNDDDGGKLKTNKIKVKKQSSLNSTNNETEIPTDNTTMTTMTTNKRATDNTPELTTKTTNKLQRTHTKKWNVNKGETTKNTFSILKHRKPNNNHETLPYENNFKSDLQMTLTLDGRTKKDQCNLNNSKEETKEIKKVSKRTKKNGSQRRCSEDVTKKFEIRELDFSPKRNTITGCYNTNHNNNNNNNNKGNNNKGDSIDIRDVCKSRNGDNVGINRSHNSKSYHTMSLQRPLKAIATPIPLSHKPPSNFTPTHKHASVLQPPQKSSSLSQLLKFPSRKGVSRKISCKDLGRADCKGWLWRLVGGDSKNYNATKSRSYSDDEDSPVQNSHRRTASLPRPSSKSSSFLTNLFKPQSSSLLKSLPKSPSISSLSQPPSPQLPSPQPPSPQPPFNALPPSSSPSLPRSYARLSRDVSKKVIQRNSTKSLNLSLRDGEGGGGEGGGGGKGEGLGKEGKGKWKKYWFLLLSKQLYFFSQPTAEKADMMLTLTSFKVSPVNLNDYKKFTFKLWNEQEEHVLASDRFKDMTKWMNKMALSSLRAFDTHELHSHHIAGFHQSTPPLPKTSLPRSLSSKSPPSSSKSLLKDSQEDLSKICRQIDRADVMIDGRDKLQRRSTLLKGNEKSKKLLQLLSLKRTLKDKENELEEISLFLSTLPITTHLLNSFHLHHPFLTNPIPQNTLTIPAPQIPPMNHDHSTSTHTYLTNTLSSVSETEI